MVGHAAGRCGPQALVQALMAQEQGCCGVRNCAELWGCKWTRQEDQRTSEVSTGNQLVKLDPSPFIV